MTLVSSGEIALAGSTSGRSVAVELGQSATGTISLNDTNVRTLLQKSSGTISLYDAYGKSNVTMPTITTFSLSYGSAYTDAYDDNGNYITTVYQGQYNIVTIAGTYTSFNLYYNSGGSYVLLQSVGGSSSPYTSVYYNSTTRSGYYDIDIFPIYYIVPRFASGIQMRVDAISGSNTVSAYATFS